MTCGRTRSPATGAKGTTGACSPSASTAPVVSDAAQRLERPPGGDRVARRRRRVTASPSAASTADSQPASMRTRSSSVPSTPSTSASRSAPARARAASRASCSASTRARQPGGPLGEAVTLGDAVLVRAIGGGDSRLGRIELGEQRTATCVALVVVGLQARSTRWAQLATPRCAARRRDGGPGPARSRPARARRWRERSSPRTSAMALDALAVGARVEQRQHALALAGELLLGELEVDQLGIERVAGRRARRSARRRSGLRHPRARRRRRRRAAGRGRARSARRRSTITAPMPRAAFAELLDVAQAVADVVGAPRGQLGAGGHHLGVEPGQLRLQLALAGGGVDLGRWRAR